MCEPLDLKPNPGVCDCEFTPDRATRDLDGEESWHYLRQCVACGHRWYGLHCPHDRNQNRCPGCGIRPGAIPEIPGGAP